VSLGTRVKILRVQRGMTAKSLAEATEVSPSMISKIENDVANPSYDLLRSIAAALNTSLSSLVEPQPGQLVPEEQPAPEKSGHRDGQIVVVRPQERKVLHLPSSGLTYQILTPDLQGDMEMGWVEMEPGMIGKASFAHQTGEECILVLEGSLNVYIEEELFALQRGDCLTFDCRLSHRYANEGAEKTVWVYVAVPPVL
jgi:transcriptional regulator with XRE-family HTH domain